MRVGEERGYHSLICMVTCLTRTRTGRMRTTYSYLESEDIAVIRDVWTERIGDNQLKWSQRKEKQYEEKMQVRWRDEKRRREIMAVNGSHFKV